MSQTQGDQARELSRRTVAAGAAWTVPVIAVGAAAPAMAASQNIIVIELDPLASCKFPGQSTEFNHAYDLVFTITAAEAGILCITDVFAPNNTPDEVEIFRVTPGGGPDNCRPILAGETTLSVIITAQNSANGTALFTYSFQGVAGIFTAVITNFPRARETCPDPLCLPHRRRLIARSQPLAGPPPDGLPRDAGGAPGHAIGHVRRQLVTTRARPAGTDRGDSGHPSRSPTARDPTVNERCGPIW